MNLAERLNAWVDGSLDEDEVIQLFQELVDTGVAWNQDGYVGGMIRGLVEAGLVAVPEDAQDAYEKAKKTRGW